MSWSRVHRWLAVVLVVPLVIWSITGVLFHLKPGWSRAYDMLSAERPLDAMPAVHFDALADAWAKDASGARAKLLADNAAAFAASPVDAAMFGGRPLLIDSVEWFASPRDMARTLDWLRRNGDATTRAILAVNPGAGAATADRFDYIGYKGGSEPGVITLNFLVRTKAGKWLAVTGNWHNPDAAVSEAGFAALMNRALLLAAR